MWLTLFLILVSTAAGVLTLWRDELVYVAPLQKIEETDEEKGKRLEEELKREKTKRTKFLSSIFILCTLLLTLWQIWNSEEDKEQVRKKHIEDSLRHDKERDADELANKTVDSVHDTLQATRLALMRASLSIDTIKAKSDSTISSLRAFDSMIKRAEVSLRNSTLQAQNSFKDLTKAAERQAYQFDSLITMTFEILLRHDKAAKAARAFIDTTSELRHLAWMTPDWPYYADVENLFRSASIHVSFYDPQNVLSPRMVIYNRDSMKVISGLTIQYDDDKRLFRFWWYMPMRIEYRTREFFSAVDFEKNTVKIILQTPDDKERRITLDSTRASITIDFVNRIASETYLLDREKGSNTFTSYFLINHFALRRYQGSEQPPK